MNGIVDVTENYENYEQGSNDPLPRFLVLIGKYNPNSENKVVIKGTDISLVYVNLFNLSNSYITWTTPMNADGITFVELYDPNVYISSERGNTKVLYFDCQTINSVGKIKMKQDTGEDYSIELCMTELKNLKNVNRSEIFNGINGCGGEAFDIPADKMMVTTSTRNKNVRPNGLSICLNAELYVKNPDLIPLCPGSMQKAWENGKYIRGACCTNDKTYVAWCYGKKCFKPDTNIDGINLWKINDSNRCMLSKNRNNIEKKYDGDVNTIAGSGISNLKEGVGKLVDNTSNFRNRIYNMQLKMAQMDEDVNDRRNELKKAEELINQNKRIIKRKMQILDNRGKQLQQAVERNIYWKKVLYVIFSLIIVVIVVILLVSSFMKKQN